MPDRRAGNEHQDNAVAVVGVVVGVAFLLVSGLHGDWGLGTAGLVIVLAYGALMYGLRRRSEPAQLLAGRPADERQAAVMLKASAVTGQLLIAAVVVGMLACLAVQSRYAAVFTALSAGAGAAFIASTIWFSRRG